MVENNMLAYETVLALTFQASSKIVSFFAHSLCLDFMGLLEESIGPSMCCKLSTTIYYVTHCGFGKGIVQNHNL